MSSLAEANRAHFKKKDSSSSSSSTTPIRLLDYACGPGLMTRIFAPYTTHTLGIDIAPNMVSEYNQRARSANIPRETALAVEGDLFDKADPSPLMFDKDEWRNFDLAAVGFAFHHFEDVGFAAGQLKERLRPGGVLVISDFLEGGDMLADEEGGQVEGSEGNHAVHGHGHGHGHGGHHGHHGHGHGHGCGHGHGHGHYHHDGEKGEHDHQHAHEHGEDDNTPEFKKRMNASINVWHFTIEGVKKFLTEAGFVDVDVITMKEKVYMEMSGMKLWRTVLFAKGRRPVEGKSEL